MNKQQLFENIKKKQSFLCVGLDTDIKKIPQHLLSEEDPIFAFNKAIIDATADYCVAYKPNLAFYESLGTKGMMAFEKTVAYLRENYPDQFIIADAKRGDIGNTSEMYARSFFDHIKVDAVTVAPYMGEDSVKPFLIYPEAWVILLALTSNKGSHDFQMTEDANGERLFEKVLKKSQEWANCTPRQGDGRQDGRTGLRQLHQHGCLPGRVPQVDLHRAHRTPEPRIPLGKIRGLNGQKYRSYRSTEIPGRQRGGTMQSLPFFIVSLCRLRFRFSICAPAIPGRHLAPMPDAGRQTVPFLRRRMKYKTAMPWKEL